MLVIDWCLLLETVQGISSFCFYLTKISNPSFPELFLWYVTVVSLFDLHSRRQEEKINPNTFSWSIYNVRNDFIWVCAFNHVHFFDNVCPIDMSWVW